MGHFSQFMVCPTACSSRPSSSRQSMTWVSTRRAVARSSGSKPAKSSRVAGATAAAFRVEHQRQAPLLGKAEHAVDLLVVHMALGAGEHGVIIGDHHAARFASPDLVGIDGGDAGDQTVGGRVLDQVVEIANRFISADRYLIAAPMWNSGIPYRLKQYIDLIHQPGLLWTLDPATGYQVLVDGQAQVVGGTSAVAPLWAQEAVQNPPSLGKYYGFSNRAPLSWLLLRVCPDPMSRGRSHPSTRFWITGRCFSSRLDRMKLAPSGSK